MRSKGADGRSGPAYVSVGQPAAHADYLSYGREREFAVALILVVDDDATVRAVVADTLAQDGHEVDTAQDGVDALYLLKRRTYDIIISDLRMPILDGPGLYRSLQQRDATVLPHVIFVTGYADAEPYTAFLAQTGAPVLMKPFTPEELRLMIRWVLET
jgi:DNA-binding response OmpR family regulator